MKKLFKNFNLIFLVLVAQAATAADAPVIDNMTDMIGMLETTNAMESSALRISLDSDLNGFVEGKVCDFCDEIKVTITPDTRAYADGDEVPLLQAKNRIGRFATVFYDVKTKNVTAIRW